MQRLWQTGGPQTQWGMLFGGLAPLEHGAPGRGKTERCVKAAGELLREHFDLVGTTERFDETMLVWARQLNASRPLHYVRVNEKRNAEVTRPPPSLCALRRVINGLLTRRNPLPLS